MIGAKILRIRFNKIDGFVRVSDWTRYLLLFGGEKYDLIYNRVRYLIEVKNQQSFELPLDTTVIFSLE